MKLVNSVCTNLFFPESRKSIGYFHEMARFLSGKGIDFIEFYHDGAERGKVGSILSDTGLKGMYIAVIPSKEKKLYLCDEDEGLRNEAVKLFMSCIDEAQDNGICEVMINSGRMGKSEEAGLKNLAESVEKLFNHIERKNYGVKLLMEPCDSRIDAFHLIGPYRRTYDFVKSMHEKGMPLELTMDTAHTAEEGEDFLEALTAVKQFCSQIHFANCYIRDPADEFYGDRHLGFEFPDTEWTYEALAGLFYELEKLYAGDEPLRIGLEVLCRTGNPYAYFEDTWNSLSFLHRNRQR